jgi:iron complex outermembrane receptor protein
MPNRTLGAAVSCGLLAALLVPSHAAAQAPLTTSLPPITVTAQKEPQDPGTLPVSVTAVPSDTIVADALTSVSQAGWFSPNTFFNEFTARKLSNPRFRGVGSSPANPGITSYIDGVPQLNANSSSIEFLDVEQVEFVRGPQSALFGRNALGGIINITSARPSLTRWTGNVAAPFGNFGTADVRGSASGPIAGDTVAASVGFGFTRRDGFTVNDVSGNDLDSRSAWFGRGQILWKPNARWETRAILSGERARDGDYALNDLASLRANPYHAARDFEGFTHRDIIAPTVQVNYLGPKIEVSTTSGFLKWKTDDSTDLDYTPFPAATRSNNEEDFQFTEEARIASSKAAPIALGSGVTLRWQAGLFIFTQNYTQHAVNTYSPFVLAQTLGITVAQTTPDAALDDRGLGVYGQGTFTFANKLDVVVGARGDREHKNANVSTFFTPGIAPPQVVDAEKDFSDVSPQFAVAYRVASKATIYGTVARGFKAGGFNPTAPPGGEAYDQEHNWNYEGGVKTSAFNGRVAASVAAFHIDWRDLQLNVPNPFVPAQFYIANAAGATSNGVEFELHARPDRSLDLFGGAGFIHARYKDGSVASGVDIAGNTLANAPSYTADVGVQYGRALRGPLALFVRAEAICYGSYEYDEANAAGQDAYTLTNLRVGVRGKRAYGELWLRNAFDTTYIPTAFPFPGAPSGFLGENGAPRTIGVRFGVGF